MGVYTGIAQDNVTINSGRATLQTATVADLTVGASGLTLPVETVAAAGSTAANAGVATTYGVIHATGADATKGIKLPTAAAGKVVIVKNADAANAVLKVYPGTDDKINSATATTGSLNMAAKTSAMFVAISDVDWFSVPLLPS
jgi:hypothetical protein